MKIRQSQDADRLAISAIHTSAFGPEQGPEIVGLVHDLFEDETAKPLLSLVAETEARLVGHILFTVVKLQPELKEISARILAPLAVASDVQGQGIGGELIKAGLQQLADSGVDLVFVLGHPDYYPRFGFQTAGVLGFAAPHPIPTEHTDAWMVQALTADVLGRASGTVQCSEVLNQPQHWQA
ncbi:MAG: N-acetyltransferase [Leptolyngbya sp. RL_3_1]|nr:N-acetyltransferase [Leptolyngbya sp. RL_3_1]